MIAPLAELPMSATDSAPPPAAQPPSVEIRAAALAERLLVAARAGQTRQERGEVENLARMMRDPAGKAFTVAMVDETFRSARAKVRAARWREMLRQYGMPHYLRPLDRFLMGLAAAASRFFPGLVMRAVESRMRKDSARVILSGEKQPLHHYLAARRQDGFRVNLNHLGEAVLGEEEARRRLDAVLGHLEDPDVSYISVKISAIFSQIHLPAWEASLAQIKERLRLLYRCALRCGKFVNLDMEEYRDLALTIAAFCEVLDEPEFSALSAGIVLQAYLPDAWTAQQRLTEWARRRVAAGGAPVKIRLVKGANLAMEAVEAELHGWNPAPYQTKALTDANFRRMLEFGCRKENAQVVRLGVASHNLFDVALALTLRADWGSASLVEIEMLEGMANHQARVVREAAGNLLVYAPAVQRTDFLSAMAYLMRRLDENTAAGNFLRDVFALQPGSTEWNMHREEFLRGWRQRNATSCDSRRAAAPILPQEGFYNQPDTDWSQPAARQALADAMGQHTPEAIPEPGPLEDVMAAARLGQQEWSAISLAERSVVLLRAADVLEHQRFATIACLRHEGKKAVMDADAEVSEAVDFARYYAGQGEIPNGLRATPMGIIVVTPPWNFPYAIPCSGVLAALMAGNAVILKPAPETRSLAWLLVRQLWAAGVPRSVLQFFPCQDGPEGRALICHPSVAGIVLTGAWETARMFQQWRPSLRLFAETSGKNALIITAQADRDLAIKDLVRAAFGHAGQKCSAASLAIVEAEVYDDPAFRRQLRDTAASLAVGPATDPRSVVTPLIREPGAALRRALTTLAPGEEWLLEPRQSPDDPCQWSPGILLGVAPGSWFHQTECFGPVLGIMRADSLDQAIAWQNDTAYGLTAGLHSLDKAEIARWRESVHAGNLYINRPITGAIVRRQPFGGWKRSCIGPGAKAGGPNYVWNFLDFAEAAGASPADAESDYRASWESHFALEHDPSALKSESNIFRYRPARGVVLRLESHDDAAISRARLASSLTGTPLHVSLRSEEPDDAFARRLPELARQAEFLRLTGPCGDQVLLAAADAGMNWICAPLTACGRVELRYWLREQAVSATLHRHGQIPEWQPAPAERSNPSSRSSGGVSLANRTN